MVCFGSWPCFWAVVLRGGLVDLQSLVRDGAFLGPVDIHFAATIVAAGRRQAAQPTSVLSYRIATAPYPLIFVKKSPIRCHH